MSLKTAIIPYLDSNGYVNPYKTDPTVIGRQCDNSTMFTSEFFILLAKNKELSEDDKTRWKNLIITSMASPGLTERYPGASTEIDSPDNLIGILAASRVLNMPEVAASIYDYGKKHWGMYNPTGKWNWSAFMWRQPQLIYAMLLASKRARWWHLPLELYTAAVIALSARNKKITDADPRRLSWLLIQATQDSWLCRMAAKIWTKRLMRDYGPSGMKWVAAVYYPSNHPFVTYYPEY